MVSVFLATFVRCTLRRRDAWVLLAGWAALWYLVAWLAPVGVVDVTSSSVVLIYQIAYLSCLCGGAAALHFLERLDSILRRLPPWRRSIAALTAHALVDAAALLVACAACSRHVLRSGDGVSSSIAALLCVAATSIVLGATIACAPSLRGLRPWIYVVALFAIVCVITPRANGAADVHRNFELVSRLLPILGLSLTLVLVTRGAGSTR
jgi:hypothetical protein